MAAPFRYLVCAIVCVSLTTCAGGTSSSTGAGGQGGVRIVVEPGDQGRAFLSALQNARSSIHMTMYLLTDEDVLRALVDRHRMGVDVKVILNHAFSAGSPTNDGAFAELQAAGVPVVWAPARYRLTHAKAVIVDASVAWIMTMNAVTSAARNNREYLVAESHLAASSEAENVFRADFAGEATTPAGPLLVAPSDARPKLEALASSATARIDFEAEELTDAAMTSALCDAAARGVSVRGVLPLDVSSPAQSRATARLTSCGVSLRRLAAPYVHAKALVVDGKRVYVGSENFSAASLDDNRELGLETDDPTAVDTIQRQIATDYAAASAP